jgi:DNA-binding transcriptional MerR regulator
MAASTSERDHRSIGEVLALLQEDFPDVTISKIRFLETQGLISPERTPSGYRKFYEDDVERLRWILTQQKIHFLPLKVIRNRLERKPLPYGDGSKEVEKEAETAPTKTRKGKGKRASGEAAPESQAETESGAHTESSGIFGTGERGKGVSMEELTAQTGLTPPQVRELERLGLLSGTELAGEVLYDDDAVEVAKLAVTFRAQGVEARHLRMYKVAAEREAGFYEQLLVPVKKSRSADSRAVALERLEDLVGLGADLRTALLRHMLRDRLGPS